MRALLEGFLRELGFTTVFATDGGEALRLLGRSAQRAGDAGRISLVIADVELTGLSGVDILIAVRSNHWNVPVVLTSEYLPTLLRTEAVRLGAAAVLSKPVSLTALRGVLDTHLGRLP